MALPLDTQGVTSFAVSAIVEPVICVRIESAVFRKLSLIVLDAFAESTFRKSFDDKRKCHSGLTPTTTTTTGIGQRELTGRVAGQ